MVLFVASAQTDAADCWRFVDAIGRQHANEAGISAWPTAPTVSTAAESEVD